ncbi:M17 family peptidase N-terminal domain-containing protein [Myxococcota bacterium]
MSVRLASGDLAGLDSQRPEAVAVFCFSDVRPLAGGAGYLDWRVCGAISRRIESGAFGARQGEIILLPTQGRLGRQRLFVFGLGALATCDGPILKRVCRDALEVMRRAGAEKPVFVAPAAHDDSEIEGRFVRALSEELPREVAVLVLGEIGDTGADSRAYSE